MLYKPFQSDRKFVKPISDTCSVSEKNYTEIGEQKTVLYKVLEMPAAFSDACIHSFHRV
jgi:hypothetical protein